MRAAPPGAARQFARSSSLITGFTSHGPVGFACGAGSTRACGFTTIGGPGSTRAARPGAARQLARSCSDMTGVTMQGPFGLSVSAGAATGGGAGLTDVGFSGVGFTGAGLGTTAATAGAVGFGAGS